MPEYFADHVQRKMRAIFKALICCYSDERSTAVGEFRRLLATPKLDVNLAVHNNEERESIGNSILGECVYLVVHSLHHRRRSDTARNATCSRPPVTRSGIAACLRLLIDDRRVDVNRPFFDGARRQTGDGGQLIAHGLFEVMHCDARLAPPFDALLGRTDLDVSRRCEGEKSRSLLAYMAAYEEDDCEWVRKVINHASFDGGRENSALRRAVYFGREGLVNLLLNMATIDVNAAEPLAEAILHREPLTSDPEYGVKYNTTQYYTAHTRILRALFDSARVNFGFPVKVVYDSPSVSIVRTMMRCDRFDMHKFVTG